MEGVCRDAGGFLGYVQRWVGIFEVAAHVTAVVHSNNNDVLHKKRKIFSLFGHVWEMVLVGFIGADAIHGRLLCTHQTPTIGDTAT